MRRFAGLVLFSLAAACTPAPSVPGPEAVVQTIYQPLVDSKGEKTTSLAEMPLSEDLKALVDKAEAAAKDEPVFDGDVAGDCQDCEGFSDLKLAAAGAAVPAGHQAVQASFKLFGGEGRSVIWDMVKTPQGWRVDNVLSTGFDLRLVARQAIDLAAAPQPAPSTPPAQ